MDSAHSARHLGIRHYLDRLRETRQGLDPRGVGSNSNEETKMKLDAKFYGEIRKAKDDTRVPDDEYVVFLAKDNAFAAILPLYAAKCAELGCDPDQIAAIDRMVDRVLAWRAANPDRLKNPDAKGERLLA